MDCSPPGSSVHRILQARKLEWVAISFSRGSPRPRDRTLNYMSIIPEAVLKIKAMKPQRDPVSHHQRVRRPAMIAHSVDQRVRRPAMIAHSVGGTERTAWTAPAHAWCGAKPQGRVGAGRRASRRITPKRVKADPWSAKNFGHQ